MNYDIDQIILNSNIQVVFAIPGQPTSEELTASFALDGYGLYTLDTGNRTIDSFYKVAGTLERLKEYISDGISFNISYTNQEGQLINIPFEANTQEALNKIRELSVAVRRWPVATKAAESSLGSSMSLYNHPAMGMIPRASDYSTPQMSTLANSVVTASRRANELLLGSEDISLQVGYIEFGPENLGPDSVFISEVNEVSSVDSVRSRTDISIKGSAGRSLIEIDMIFKDEQSINTKFRELLAMLKMAPIIPIGGSAVSAAIINRITASKTFQDFKDKLSIQGYKSVEGIESLLNDQLTTASDPSSGLTAALIKDIVRADRATLEYLTGSMRTSAAEDAAPSARTNEKRTPNISEIVPESLKTMLINVVLDSVTVSTVASMPGAIRARLSFMRHHDITSENGDLLFIDQYGNPTYDIRKCLPLSKAVKAVFLDPTRRKLTKNASISNEKDNNNVNPDYIPMIGDSSIVKTKSGNMSGTLSGIPLSRISKSETGHNLFLDPVNGLSSSVLFRFATSSDPTSVVEYIPFKLITQSVTWTLQNKIAIIPIEGQLLPAVQFMGRGGVNGSITFMTTDRSAVQEFMTVKASIDEISTSRNLGQLLRREFVDIYNDVVNISGSTRFIISSATVQTSPDNPGLYMITIQIISNEENIETTEKLEVMENTKASPNEMEDLWWWLYRALVTKYEAVNLLEPGKILDRMSFNKEAVKGLPNSAKNILSKKLIIKGVTGGGSDGPAGGSEIPDECTLEEIELALRFIRGYIKDNREAFGFEPDSVPQSGLVERNMLIAAIVDAIREEQIGPVLDKQITYRNARDSADVTNTIRTFIRERIVSLSRRAEEAGDISSYDEDLGGHQMIRLVLLEMAKENSYGIAANKSPLFSDFDKQNKVYSDPLIEAVNDTQFTLYENIYKDMDSLPTSTQDSAITMVNIIGEGLSIGQGWIPTPALWQRLYKVMTSPGKYITNTRIGDGKYKTFPAGVFYPRPGWFSLGVGPIFYISKVWATNKSRLNNFIIDPSSKRLLPSFFLQPSRKKLYDQIGSSGFDLNQASKHNFTVNPEVFERRNCYQDMGMPRYSEIFSVDPSASDPIPLKTPDGYEVWRKVAPTYAELGEPANIYRSLNGLIHQNGKFAFKKPSLLTPRVFQDYCDPGFFYHKKTWINKSYDDLVDEIKIGTTVETKFMPSGPNGNHTYNVNEIDRLRIKYQDDDEPEILSVHFSIAEIAQPEAAAQRTGTRTTGILEDSLARKENMSTFIADAVVDSLNRNRIDPSSGAPSFKERIRQDQNKTKRYMVVDTQGVRIGMLVVDKKGAQNTSSSNVKRVVTGSDGNNRVSIPTSPGQRQGFFNGEEFANKSITFIDMTNEFNKPAEQKSYLSSTEILKYNEYSKKDSAQVLKRQLEFAGDNVLNKSRNYPTFRLYFVKEQLLKDGNMFQFSVDDAYGYASVISIDVMHDKEDASTAVISMTDITSVLSSSLFRRQVISDSGIDKKFDEKTNPNTRDDESETPYKIMLEVGTNIVVKMGYGQDPEYLKTVFTGAVAEIQPGEVTTIVAQSYRTEMFKYINFYGSNGLIDWVGGKLGFTEEKNWTHPLFLVHHILVKLAKVSGVEDSLSLSGLPHFGRFMVMADFLELSSKDKMDFTSEYNDFVGRNIPSEQDAEFSSLSAAGLMVPVAAGAAYFGVGAIVGAAAVIGAGLIGGYSDRYQRYVAKYDDLHIHTNAMRNVFISESFETNFWDYLDQEWVADGSGWSCLKEVARYKVNHICTEVPYGSQATLFMGKPDNLYHYKPLDRKSMEYYNQISPVFSRFALDQFSEKLIEPFFSSSQYKDENLAIYFLRKILSRISSFTNEQRYEFPFSDESFLHSEEIGSFVRASDVIGQLSQALFPGSTDGSTVQGKGKTITFPEGLNLTDSPVSSDTIVVYPNITLDLISPNGVGPGTSINGLDLSPIDRSELLKLGYSGTDYIGFRILTSQMTGRDSTRTIPTELIPVSKQELDEYGISVKTGLPEKNRYILPTNKTKEYKESQYFPTTATLGRSLPGIGVYNRNGNGYIIPAQLKISNRNQSNADTYEFEKANAPVTLISEQFAENASQNSNVPIKATIISDNTNDLNLIIDSSKAVDSSLIKTLFAVFFGLDYSAGNGGSVSFASDTIGRSANIFGNVDSFAVEFTRALMGGEGFVKTLDLERSPDIDLAPLSGVTDTNEKILKAFNIKLERICRSYFMDSGRINSPSITYGQLKLKSRSFDYDKANKVFTDNLVQAVESGFMSSEEIKGYIANSRLILDRASGKIDIAPGDVTGLEQAATDALQKSYSERKRVLSQIRADDNHGMLDVVMNNANKYKLFLIYFARFLRENPSIAASAIGISETIEWLAEGVPPDQKPFRDTHIVMSGTDIIKNDIVATTSQLYNNILMFGPSDIVVKEVTGKEEEDQNIVTIDEANTSWLPFPNFQNTGVDFNPYVSPENRKQLQVRERNAESLLLKTAALINHVAEGMRPMYRGNIKIVGRNVKPYDLILVIDQFKSMFGFIEVERVVHNFSAREGWTTTITPHTYVVPLDEVQSVARRFDTKKLEYLMTTINVLDTTFNLFLLYGLLFAPLKAAAVSAGKKVASTTLSATVSADVAKSIAADGLDKVVSQTLLNLLGGGALRRQSFMAPFLAEARKLAGAAATESQVNKLSVQLLLKSSPDWMGKGEFMSALGDALLKSIGSGKVAFAYLGRDLVYSGIGGFVNIATQCQISSTIMPIHVFCLMKSSRVFAAGLDTRLSRFYNFSERLGYSMNNASSSFQNFIYELTTLEDNVTTERNPLPLIPKEK